MTLETYLKRPDAKSLTELSRILGITKGRMSQLRKSREWPAELAMLAEERTGGLLDASALSATVARARKPFRTEAA